MLVFDGECGFCTWTAGWVARHVSRPTAILAWQDLGDAGLRSLGLTADDARAAAWWVERDGGRSRGHRAIGMALRAVGGPARVAGTLALVPPSSWLAAGIYRLVVRYRHRLPGSTAACRVS